MLIKKSEARMKENSKNCTVWEYEFPSKDFSYATSVINGRYPDKWSMTNLECEQIYFVISGSWIIHFENENFEMNTWDLYFFEKWEKYWVEWNNLFISISNSPKWKPEQYRIID